jgi:hypothetical protein
VAAPHGQLVAAGAERGQMGEQWAVTGMVGGGWSGAGARVPVRRRWAAVMTQMARAAITSTVCRAIAWLRQT